MSQPKTTAPVLKIEKTYGGLKTDNPRYQLAASRTGGEIKFTLSQTTTLNTGEGLHETAKDLYTLHLNFVGLHLKRESDCGRLVHILLQEADGEKRPRGIEVAGNDFIHLHKLFEKGDFNKLFHDAFHCINIDLNEKADRAIRNLPEIGTENIVKSVLALPELRKDQPPA